MIKSSKPNPRLQAIMEEASQEAGFIDEDLAADVDDARRVRRKYLSHPLHINVPILGALLAGKLGILFVSMTWKPHKPHASDKEYKKSGLHVEMGNFPVKNPEGEIVGDDEFFNVGQILDAGEPDINYIWIIDWIRQLQGILNWIGKFFGAPEIKRLDLWGSIFWRAKDGEDTIFLPLVQHPRKIAGLIIDLSDRVDAGDVAFAKLIKRRDEERRK